MFSWEKKKPFLCYFCILGKRLKVKFKHSLVFAHLLEFLIYAVNILVYKLRYLDTRFWYVVKTAIVFKKGRMYWAVGLLEKMWIHSCPIIFPTVEVSVNAYWSKQHTAVYLCALALRDFSCLFFFFSLRFPVLGQLSLFSWRWNEPCKHICQLRQRCTCLSILLR